jgi:hypothetical protein
MLQEDDEEITLAPETTNAASISLYKLFPDAEATQLPSVVSWETLNTTKMFDPAVGTLAGVMEDVGSYFTRNECVIQLN